MVESVVEWVSEWVEEEHDAINNTKEWDDMEDENNRDASWYFLCWWRLDGSTCVEAMKKTKNMMEFIVSCLQKRMGIKFQQKISSTRLVAKDGFDLSPPPVADPGGGGVTRGAQPPPPPWEKNHVKTRIYKIYKMSCLWSYNYQW